MAVYPATTEPQYRNIFHYDHMKENANKSRCVSSKSFSSCFYSRYLNHLCSPHEFIIRKTFVNQFSLLKRFSYRFNYRMHFGIKP